MRKLHNPRLVQNSRNLRKQMTKEEKRLWYEFLKDLSVPFYRQRIMGEYIVDFCCPSRKLVIELDGSQHYEQDAQKKDEERDKKLAEIGYTVKRYSNLDINKRFNAVCNDIYNFVFGNE